MYFEETNVSSSVCTPGVEWVKTIAYSIERQINDQTFPDKDVGELLIPQHFIRSVLPQCTFVAELVDL